MRRVSLLLIMILLVPLIGSALIGKISSAGNGLVAYWNLDEGSGLTASDSSGNGNIGTLINGPTWIGGIQGKALKFDGIDDYVNISQNVDLNPHTNNWTVSAWVNIGQFGSPQAGGEYGLVIIDKRQTAEDFSLTLVAGWGSSPTSQACFGFIYDGPFQLVGARTPFMNVFGWHYLTGVRSGGNLYIYVDGIGYGPNNYYQVGSWLTANTDVSSSTPIHLAHHGAWQSYMNGTIDEVRIYDRALGEQEILDDMSGGTIRSTTINVPGTAGDTPSSWVDTGIQLFAGQNATMSASGSVSWDDGYHWSGPDGDPGWPIQLVNPALQGAPVGALIGKTAGSILLVGSGPKVITGEGEIFLAVNDEIGGYWNNVGSFNVTILYSVRNGLLSDEFSENTLSSAWAWVDPAGDCSYNLTANPGYLRISAPGPGHDLYPFSNDYNAPRVMQVLNGDFAVETRVLFDPTGTTIHSQAAGILVWQGIDNYLRLDREQDSRGQVLELSGVKGGSWSVFNWIQYTGTTTYLRLERFMGNLTIGYSSDGINWNLLYETAFPLVDPVKVGLFVLNNWNNAPPVFADFDYFRLTGRPSSVEVSISPSGGTTSIGGTVNYQVEISNYENTFDTFAVSLLGLNSSWYSLSQNNLTLNMGEVSRVGLDVTPTEDPGAVGNFTFTVVVSGTWTRVAANASLVVTLEPIMSSLQPDNDTIIGSTSVLFSWKTSSNASSEIYIKQASDLTFNHLFGTAGENHYLNMNNLTRNADYLWYAYSETVYGNVSSDFRILYVSNGISFTQRNYTFTVNRDYAQSASVSIVNNDVQSHEVLLQADNPYNDLIVGFVGLGSVDENVTLQPGETKPIDFEVFAQDAMQHSYTFTVNLTSFGAENIADYATVNINVRQPNINLTLSEDSTDPVTLKKTITATNYGDPITDLSIGTSDELVGKVSFEPIVTHANIPTCGSLTFEAVPVLTPEFIGTSGIINAISAGRIISSMNVTFTLPPGKGVYSVTIPQVSIQFDNYYDTDDSPNTNPLPDRPVESYLANGSIVFASQIIVDVYQNNTPACDANVSLTVWNETGSVEFVEYSRTDFTGKAMFLEYGLAGNYSYEAELVGYNFKTLKRDFSVETNALFEIHQRDVTWLGVSDRNSTFDLSENAKDILLRQAPFKFIARRATIDQNATFALCLTWNTDKFKKIFVPGSMLNDTMVFETSCIPVGNFSAVVIYYSDNSGLSLSTPINVTNTDWSAMYMQGNYTYWEPFPLNSTHYIRLSIDRLVSARNPCVAFDLCSIQPVDDNSLYNLTYQFVSNETVHKEFQINIYAYDNILYNTTIDLNLEPWKIIKISLAVPVCFANGTLLSEFNSTISLGSLFVSMTVHPSIHNMYDPRIWVGSQWGFLDSILPAILPPPPSEPPKSYLEASITCGLGIALDVIPGPEKFLGTEINEQLYTIGVETGYVGTDFGLHTDELSRLSLLKREVVGFGIGASIGTVIGGVFGSVLGPPGTLAGMAGGALGGYVVATTLYDVVDCYQQWQSVHAEAIQESTGVGVCKVSKTGMWYCTNRPVVSAQISIDPPSADVLQAAIVVKFSLPWSIDTYRPHNVHLFVNGIEIGNLTNTIPNGYYIFPFNSSFLNYLPAGLSENTITMKMDSLNGGHYVVTSDWEIVLQLKQLALSVVASNQTEAENLVQQLSETVASMADFSTSPNLIFSTSEPSEGQSIMIEANVLNLGTAGMSNVPVDLYVDSAGVESAIIGFLPALSNQTVDFSWLAARGAHNVTVTVNEAELISESDYSNNQVQTTITVFAHDLGVTKAIAAKNVVGGKYPLNLNITVANNGDFAETFNVTICVNTTYVTSQNVILTSGSAANITFTLNLTGLVYGNYTFTACVLPVPGETDIANNNLTSGAVYVGIPGDIKGDGIVDIYDAILLAAHFNEHVPWLHPTIDVNVDINGDGIIDIYDAIILSGHFNQHYP